MNNLNQPYTVGNWTVKAGNEKAFIAEWQSFAAWTSKHQAGVGIGYLLQDSDHPQKFISFGGWNNSVSIKAWRDTSEFKEFTNKIKSLCEDFQPHALNLVATSKK